MRNRKFSRSLTVSILVAGSALIPFAARAQTNLSVKPISLISKGPVEAALRSLFAAAGIKNYVIDPSVQGYADVNLDGVPFSVALEQVLSTTNPPLVADIQGDAYHVHALVSDAAPAADVLATPSPGQSVRINAGAAIDAHMVNGALVTDGAVTASVPFGADVSRFFKFGVQHYDAAMLADLATRPGGIIVIPPNFVIPANSGAPVTLSGPNVSSVSSPSAFGATRPGAGGQAPGAANPSAALGGPVAAPAGPAAAINVLPDGVKRIYALESDNTLVVEATQTGAAGLTPAQ